MTSTLQFRIAAPKDLPAIMAMLADDPLGKYRELKAPADQAVYAKALDVITADANSDMIVVEQNNQVVGCLQLTLIPGLARGGAWRAQIEAVRVASDKRGQGIGTALMKHAMTEARRRGAKLVQLTSDTRRADAHRFYVALGFSASHVGFKIDL